MSRDDLPLGTLVRDLATGRVGEWHGVHATGDTAHPTAAIGRMAFLRPVGGGLEWTTSPRNVVLATPQD